MYVLTGEEQKKNRDKRIVVYKRPGDEKTEFPVKLVDKCGVEVVIAYVKDKTARDRYMNSDKYARAKKNGWKFK